MFLGILPSGSYFHCLYGPLVLRTSEGIVNSKIILIKSNQIKHLARLCPKREKVKDERPRRDCFASAVEAVQGKGGGGARAAI